MTRLGWLLPVVAALCAAGPTQSVAHPAPFSFVDLRIGSGTLDVTVVAHVWDVAYEFDIDEAPRCRYDMGIRRAEFAAAPTLSHESLAAAVSELFIRVAISLEEAGSSIELKVLRSGRLLSDDGAFEADEGLFVGASKIEAAERIDGWLDVRKGHPVPDLVVEIDRSTNSSGKLAPYFRMGVREAWTWSRRSGTAIWLAARDAPEGFRRATASVVLPGVTQSALERLLGARSGADRRYHLRRLASVVASNMHAPGDSGAMAAERGT